MFWKCYFWVLTILLSLRHLAVYDLTGGFSRIWEVIDIPMDVVLVIGLFGFCWERRIFFKLFWKMYFVAFSVWFIAGNFFIPQPQEVAEIDPPVAFQNFDMGLSITLSILMFVALFLYAFRSSEIWE